MSKKLVSQECKNEVKKHGCVCLIDSGFGPRHIYERLCDILDCEPENSDFNSDWLDHFSELHDEIENRLNAELNADGIYCYWDDDGDLLLVTEREYIISHEYDDDIQAEFDELNEKLNDIVKREKDYWIETASNGEYDLDVLGRLPDEPSTIEHVVFTDYYNHVDENTVEHYTIFNGEIEIPVDGKEFTERENVILDLTTKDMIKYFPDVLVKRNNENDYLLYDTFYLQVQWQLAGESDDNN